MSWLQFWKDFFGLEQTIKIAYIKRSRVVDDFEVTIPSRDFQCLGEALAAGELSNCGGSNNDS